MKDIIAGIQYFHKCKATAENLKENEQSSTAVGGEAGDTRTIKRVKLRLTRSGMFSGILLETAQ